MSSAGTTRASRPGGSSGGATPAALEQGDNRTRNLRVLTRLRPFVTQHRRLLVVAGLTLPLLAGAQLATPFILRLAIDNHISPAMSGQAGSLTGLWGLVAIFFAIQIVELGLRFVQIYVTQLAGQRIMHDLRMAVFEHIQRLSLSFFDRNPVGRIMTRVTSDVETLNELVSQGIVSMARDVVSLIGIVFVMVWVDWRLTLASFVVFPFVVLTLGFLRARLRDTYDRSRTFVARLNAFLQETISGMEIVQSFRQEKRNQGEFADLRGELLEIDLRAVRYSSFLSATVQAATTVSTAIVIAYGGFGVIGGALTVGILVQFLEYLRRFYMPIEDLSDKYDTLQRAAAASKKIFGLLDVDPVIATGLDQPQLRSFDDAIRFENVSFSYPSAELPEVEASASGSSPVPAGPMPTPPPVPAVADDVGSDGADLTGNLAGDRVLENFSLTIRRGERVALVGSTGSGKSTVIKLLQRLYEPQAGTVSVDGADLHSFDLRSVRRFFGMVPQDVFLFTDTIAANIGLGSSDVERADIENAARVVEAAPFINELPRGYDTRLGERGSNLSFGERQLLAFARALSRDPQVLILDEATSSVDSETESRIQRAMHHLIGDRTALIVAHRLSTIREVDRIVVLHHGEIREQGSHKELLAADGIYATLYRLQYEGLAGAEPAVSEVESA